jgi:holliday junction DNA helicase RuvA
LVISGDSDVITKITGELLRVADDAVILRIGSFEYEALIPEFVRRRLQLEIGREVSLHTIDYLEGNPMQGRLTPRLIGFLSEVEQEFFELICSVDGVGVRKALRAMVRPVREVAAAIEDQDAKSLAGLPGIGPAMAERMIAKLRRKMPKFALLVAREEPLASPGETDVVREGFDALRTLGHSEADARRLIDKALEGKKKFKDVSELLATIYDKTHAK